MKAYVTILLIACFACACSDAEVISGTYQGTFYGQDTVDATAKVTFLNASYVSIEVKSTSLQTTYTEHAQVQKNSDISYNLSVYGTGGTLVLSGYYYDTFIHINSLSSNYVFEGTR